MYRRIKRDEMQQRLLLAAIDLTLIAIAAGLAVLLRSKFTWLGAFGKADVELFLWPVAMQMYLGWFIALVIFGCYQPAKLGTGTIEYRRVLNASFATAGLLALAAYLLQYPLSRGFYVLFFGIGAPLLVFGRLVGRRIEHWLRSSGRWVMPVLLAGNRQHVDELTRILHRERWLGYRVVGAPVTDSDAPTTSYGIKILGVPNDALRAVDQCEAGGIIFAEGSFENSGDFSMLARQMEQHHARLMVVPALTDISAQRMDVRPVAGFPLVYVERPQALNASRAAKRVFDILATAIGLVVVWPLLAVVAIAIKIDDPKGPVLFKQTRVGQNGTTFECLKFRSMVVDAESRLAELAGRNEIAGGVMFKLANDPRITRVGRFIRRFSLDEFPQLFNVLKGEMSLVGPRPALPSEVQAYQRRDLRRLDVRPGMTGLWQVSGRSNLDWEDTVRLDLYYVDNWSLVQDLLILWRTVGAVLFPNGAY